MNITKARIKLKDIVENYQDKGEGGVFGYNNKLNIRPPYQREFVYGDKNCEDVIQTIQEGYPLNSMYWSLNADGTYEVMDGQQRTISACRYLTNKISYKGKLFWSLSEAERNKILDYELEINICEGEEDEKLRWFKRINIAGIKLTDQELRNSTFTGTWLTDAKKKFSNANGAAYSIAKDYVNGKPNRQEILELALKWIIKNQGTKEIEEYMSAHQHHHDADELYRHFEDVIKWVKRIFTTHYKEMKGVDWGGLYDFAAKQGSFTPEADVPAMVSALMGDEEVSDKKGIFSYVITGNEKFLNIRKFPASIARTQYTKQSGICAHCSVKETIENMEADHITPWSKGGKTDIDNCQMLCIPCNRLKGAK